jgi:hypothetical protein
VPLSVTVVGVLAALLVIESVPLAFPALLGRKATVIDTLCLGARVTGKASVLALKPVPEMLACQSVTLELPLLVMVMPCLLVAPTGTLPKLRLVGLVTTTRVASLRIEAGALLPRPRIRKQMSTENRSLLVRFIQFPPGNQRVSPWQDGDCSMRCSAALVSQRMHAAPTSCRLARRTVLVQVGSLTPD